MRRDAEKIYKYAIEASLPDTVVREGLREFTLPSGRLILVAIGKAAYRMAKCAKDILNEKIDTGIVITKYSHSEGKIEGIDIYEAGHPVPDEAGIRATERALELTTGLTERDTVLFLVSGGGSSLFEAPLCSLHELAGLTEELLASGADINEINAVRKHISRVKGGRFAEHVYPAKVYAIVLSDVIGDRLDTIASGPTAPDTSTVSDVVAILKKYGIEVSDTVMSALCRETPKRVPNAEHFIGGSVSQLALAAKAAAEALGYKSVILTDDERGIARDVGLRLAKICCENCDTDTPLAFIIGGETVVKLKGDGIGGRNQEIALAAAPLIAGKAGVAVFSVASDGTDGPTDAAGGFVDGGSFTKMEKAGARPLISLENNDSYNALKSVGGLIFTGPTGTNVNDISVALIKPDVDDDNIEKRRFANLERVLNFGISADKLPS